MLIIGHGLAIRRPCEGVVSRLPQIVYGAACFFPTGKMHRQPSGVLASLDAIPRLLPHTNALMQALTPSQRHAAVDDIVLQAMEKAIARCPRAIRRVYVAARVQKLQPTRQLGTGNVYVILLGAVRRRSSRKCA